MSLLGGPGRYGIIDSGHLPDLSTVVQRDTGWADVVLDLRLTTHNEDATGADTPRPLLEPPPRAAQTIGPDDLGLDYPFTFSGGRYPRRINAHGTTYLWWTDPTGFTGAVAMTDDGVNPFSGFLPHLAHLAHAPDRSRRDRDHRHEVRFAQSLDALRQVLTTGAWATPVNDRPADTRSLLYRLAWATLGAADLTAVPMVLRDWDIADDGGRRGHRAFPAILTLRGPMLAAEWMRLGFDTLDDVARWVPNWHPNLADATDRLSASGIRQPASWPYRIEESARWCAAGFPAEGADEWMTAARLREPTVVWLVNPTTVRRFRAEGGTPTGLAWLLASLPEGTPPSRATRAVEVWLNAVPAALIGLYVAAGFDRANAKRIYKSAQRPDEAALRVLAGLSEAPAGLVAEGL